MVQNVVAIPVFNEKKHILGVIDAIRPFGTDIVVVDDGSTDGTSELLKTVPGIHVLSMPTNLGYGAALQAAFDYAIEKRYDAIVTIDSDGQHEPELIPQFLEHAADCDIVSGSRYLKTFSVNTPVPKDRRRINSLITDQLNARLGLNLTDAFCGFKAYRVDALRKLCITEKGYAMPLELWVQAACLRLRICELPVPLVYLDPNRSFGEKLDDANERIAYYQGVLDRSMHRVSRKHDCGFQKRQEVFAGVDI